MYRYNTALPFRLFTLLCVSSRSYMLSLHPAPLSLQLLRALLQDSELWLR